MESWAAHGDLVHLRFMGESMYLMTHPDLIKQILVEEQYKFTIGPEQQETSAGVEDHAMTTATGDRWKRLRRAAHSAFTRELQWNELEAVGTRQSIMQRTVFRFTLN